MIEHFFGEKSQWFWSMAQFAAVVISLIFIYRQIKVHRQRNMLQAMASFDQKWGSNDFLAYRIATCERYDLGILKISRTEGEVLGFFEDLGIYLRRKVFDEKLVWDKYSYYVEHYWLMYEKHISEYRARENDSSWYDQFEYLNDEMKRHATKMKIKYEARTKEDIKLFIKGEKEEASSINKPQPTLEI